MTGNPYIGNINDNLPLNLSKKEEKTRIIGLISNVIQLKFRKEDLLTALFMEGGPTGPGPEFPTGNMMTGWVYYGTTPPMVSWNVKRWSVSTIYNSHMNLLSVQIRVVLFRYRGSSSLQWLFRRKNKDNLPADSHF